MGLMDKAGAADEQERSSEMLETLASKHAAVEQQLTTLTKAVKELTGHQKIMDEELTKRIDRAATSQPSASTSQQIEGVESRLSEIESTLSEFAKSLDGKRLSAASQSLVAEAQRNHAATASATEKLQAQAKANQEFVSRVGGAVQRIEKRTEERVEKAVEQVAGEAAATMTANLDASNDRAEKVTAATAKIEARQLWSAAAAMCLALLPVAVVVAGVWMAVAGLITGAQWALDVEGSVWLGIGRWLAVAVGLAGAGYALFASVRWVAALVETWRGAGMPKWPHWRR